MTQYNTAENCNSVHVCLMCLEDDKTVKLLQSNTKFYEEKMREKV